MPKEEEFVDRMKSYKNGIQKISETEKRFEEYIESYLVSDEGGWIKATDEGYRSEISRGMSLDITTLTDFVQATQPMACRTGGQG